MTTKLSNESSPADVGRDNSESIGFCKVHGDVKICGKPEDVEKFMNSLEKQGIEQPDSGVNDPVITTSDVPRVEIDSVAEVEDQGDPLDTSSDEQQSADMESVDEGHDEEVCSCNWVHGHGRRQNVTELEEK